MNVTVIDKGHCSCVETSAPRYDEKAIEKIVAVIYILSAVVMIRSLGICTLAKSIFRKLFFAGSMETCEEKEDDDWNEIKFTQRTEEDSWSLRNGSLESSDNSTKCRVVGNLRSKQKRESLAQMRKRVARESKEETLRKEAMSRRIRNGSRQNHYPRTQETKAAMRQRVAREMKVSANRQK